MVSTAMLSGTNCFDSSMEVIHPTLVSRMHRGKKSGDASLQRVRAERVAGLHGTLLVAGHEPSLALGRGAVGKGIRHHAAGRLPLQRVVADRGRRRQRRVDVAGFEEARTLLLLAVGPDARQAIR